MMKYQRRCDPEEIAVEHFNAQEKQFEALHWAWLPWKRKKKQTDNPEDNAGQEELEDAEEEIQGDAVREKEETDEEKDSDDVQKRKKRKDRPKITVKELEQDPKLAMKLAREKAHIERLQKIQEDIDYKVQCQKYKKVPHAHLHPAILESLLRKERTQNQGRIITSKLICLETGVLLPPLHSYTKTQKYEQQLMLLMIRGWPAIETRLLLFGTPVRREQINMITSLYKHNLLTSFLIEARNRKLLKEFEDLLEMIHKSKRRELIKKLIFRHLMYGTMVPLLYLGGQEMESSFKNGICFIDDLIDCTKCQIQFNVTAQNPFFSIRENKTISTWITEGVPERKLNYYYGSYLFIDRPLACCESQEYPTDCCGFENEYGNYCDNPEFLDDKTWEPEDIQNTTTKMPEMRGYHNIQPDGEEIDNVDENADEFDNQVGTGETVPEAPVRILQQSNEDQLYSNISHLLDTIPTSEDSTSVREYPTALESIDSTTNWDDDAALYSSTPDHSTTFDIRSLRNRAIHDNSTVPDYSINFLSSFETNSTRYSSLDHENTQPSIPSQHDFMDPHRIANLSHHRSDPRTTPVIEENGSYTSQTTISPPEEQFLRNLQAKEDATTRFEPQTGRVRNDGTCDTEITNPWPCSFELNTDGTEITNLRYFADESYLYFLLAGVFIFFIITYWIYAIPIARWRRLRERYVRWVSCGTIKNFKEHYQYQHRGIMSIDECKSYLEELGYLVSLHGQDDIIEICEKQLAQMRKKEEVQNGFARLAALDTPEDYGKDPWEVHLVRPYSEKRRAQIDEIREELMKRRDYILAPNNVGGCEPGFTGIDAARWDPEVVLEQAEELADLLSFVDDTIQLKDVMGVKCVILGGQAIPIIETEHIRHRVKQMIIRDEQGLPLETPRDVVYRTTPKIPDEPLSPHFKILDEIKPKKPHKLTPIEIFEKRIIEGPKPKIPKTGKSFSSSERIRQDRPLLKHRMPDGYSKFSTKLECFDATENRKERQESLIRMGEQNEEYSHKKEDRKKKKQDSTDCELEDVNDEDLDPDIAKWY